MSALSCASTDFCFSCPGSSCFLTGSRSGGRVCAYRHVPGARSEIESEFYCVVLGGVGGGLRLRGCGGGDADCGFGVGSVGAGDGLRFPLPCRVGEALLDRSWEALAATLLHRLPSLLLRLRDDAHELELHLDGSELQKWPKCIMLNA